jgi:hypothetical protein
MERMNLKPTLVQLFQNRWLKKIPSPSLVASILATIMHTALAATGFDLAVAAAALARIGFKVGEKLLPSLVTAAEKGVDVLADWLEEKLAEEPEVNETAARTLIEQAETVAETLHEARPEDKEVVADTLGEGMQAYGGATAEIAGQYAAAMKDLAELRKLVEQMQAKVEVWASQTVEAKRGSLIEDVTQYMEGKGKQEVRAEDDSIVSGVRQTIKK